MARIIQQIGQTLPKIIQNIKNISAARSASSTPVQQTPVSVQRTPVSVAPAVSVRQAPISSTPAVSVQRTPIDHRQQMDQTLSAISRSLGNISAGLPSFTPEQRTQVSDVLNTLGPVLRKGGEVIRGVPTAAPAITATPAATATPEVTAPPITPRAILEQYKEVLRQTPPTIGLLPEERQTFADEKTQLRARYESALGALRQKQEEEKNRLMGRYAAMGFSEPGALGGMMASEPGIVTKAIRKVKEGQARELAGFEQARAGDTLAVVRAEQDALRRARAEEADIFNRRQEAAIRNLGRQLELARPEEFSVGGRMFARDRATGEIRDITPANVGWTTQTDEKGNVFRVNPNTGEFQRIGGVAAKASTGWTTQTDKMGNVFRINPNTGEFQRIGGVAVEAPSVPASASASASVSVPANVTRDNRIRAHLNTQRGTDGLVYAGAYAQALQDWIRTGGSQNNFFLLFPQASWMNNRERERFRKFIGVEGGTNRRETDREKKGDDLMIPPPRRR